jgi:cytidylate kinase
MGADEDVLARRGEEVVAGPDGGQPLEPSTAPVVTLFETYGSGASYIGPRVAQVLGVPFREQAFSSGQLEQAAELREREGLLARVFSAMGFSDFGGVDTGDVASAQRDRYDLVVENTATVQRWAREGGVMVGRNGAFILADWPAALHVLLDGPLQQRVARAAKEAGISLERAARRQKNEDQVRTAMSLELYGWDPRDPSGYDLVVNTGRLDLDACVELIAQAWRVKTGRRAG